MAIKYTHDFQFYYDGSFVRGEADIKNNKMNFVFGEFSNPLPTEILDKFNEFIKFIDSLATKDIKNISLIKKEE